MTIVWLVYLIFLSIFAFIGWTGVFHAKNYSLAGDLTKKTGTIYMVIMISIFVVSILLVLKNGVNAPIEIPEFKFNFVK